MCTRPALSFTRGLLIAGALVPAFFVALDHVPLSQTGYYGQDLRPFLIGQSLALVGICGTLRWQGFRLLLEQDDQGGEPESGETDSRHPAGSLRSTQFGLRHVLIWTTSIAVSLAVARAFDLLTPAGMKSMLSQGWPAFAAAGAVIAIVLVIALWAALGRGPAWLRWTLLALAAATFGAATFALNTFNDPWRYGFSLGRRSYWNITDWRYYAEHEWWIIAWVALAGALLFSALLIHRTLGYRLIRRTENRKLNAEN
jgi:hypothetical protein